MPLASRAYLWVGLVVCGALSNCASAKEPAQTIPVCVTLNTACQPLYQPATYATIYANTFSRSCAIGSGTCHSEDAKKGGLFFKDPLQAYDLLLGHSDGRARVLPEDPGCSILAQRLESTDRNFRMPPGDGLAAAELCDIVQWLGAGAPSD
jgi:hypothetical protein